MSRENNRDRAIDQLLRQAAGDPSAPADAHTCVDGETLAAWTAGTLRAVEAAAVEHHVADCGRCQAMLATLVRTTPVPPIADAWWRQWNVRWLVPIATAATVAAVWVALPTEERQHTRFVTEPSAQLKAPAEPAQPPAQGVSSSRETAIAKDDSAREIAEKRPAGSIARQTNRADEKQVRKPARADADQAAAPAAVPESRAAGAREERLAETASRARSVPAPAAPPAAPPASAPEGTPVLAQERDALRSAAQIRVIEIVSPDPTHRWRIIGASQIQHSTTGGAAWQEIVLPSADAMLTAGHSPAPSTVWLVGRGGAIFVTADALHLVRVPFTEPIDLVSVRAIDDRQATVTAADGRMFRTTDRGATWIAGNP